MSGDDFVDLVSDFFGLVDVIRVLKLKGENVWFMLAEQLLVPSF